MTWKERFEQNSVVFCATLVVIGFASGFSARGYVLPQTRSAPISCTVEGLPSLEQEHTQRLSALQNSLVNFEKSAADQSLLTVYQDHYEASADRTRKDIAAENASYQQALRELSFKCPSL